MANRTRNSTPPVKTKPKRSTSHRSPARFIARVLPGARPAPFLGFVEPQVPILKRDPPNGERWVFEIKLDGYRVQAHLRGGKPALKTRSGLDWTGRFRSIAKALGDVRANDLILDGEVVVPDANGVPSFSLLQAELAAGRSGAMLFHVFDVMFLDGFDLRAAPLIERKRVLAELLAPVAPPILFSPHTEGDGKTIFEHACEMGLEGIVAKRRDAPYRSGKSETWTKIKCVTRASFSVIGFDPDRDSIAALYLARREGKSLVYAGKVGTGFTRKSAHALRQVLDTVLVDRPLVKLPMRTPKAVWVRPQFEAEIEYRGCIAGKVGRRRAALRREGI